MLDDDDQITTVGTAANAPVKTPTSTPVATTESTTASTRKRSAPMSRSERRPALQFPPTPMTRAAAAVALAAGRMDACPSTLVMKTPMKTSQGGHAPRRSSPTGACARSPLRSQKPRTSRVPRSRF